MSLHHHRSRVNIFESIKLEEMTGLKPPTLNVEIAGKIVELYIFGSVKYTFETFDIILLILY